MELDVARPVLTVQSMRQSIVQARSIVKLISPMLAQYELTVDDWLIMDSLAEESGQTMAQLADRTKLPA